MVQIYLAAVLKTLPPNGPFASNSFFRPKTILKVAIIKIQSATTAFFSSSSFFLVALSFSFVSIVITFAAYQAPKTCLLTPFHTNDCNFRQVGFHKIGQIFITVMYNTELFLQFVRRLLRKEVIISKFVDRFTSIKIFRATIDQCNRLQNR